MEVPRKQFYQLLNTTKMDMIKTFEEKQVILKKVYKTKYDMSRIIAKINFHDTMNIFWEHFTKKEIQERFNFLISQEKNIEKLESLYKEKLYSKK